MCAIMVLVLGGCGDSAHPFSDDDLSAKDVDKLLKDGNFKTDLEYIGKFLIANLTISNDKEFIIQYSYSESSTVLSIIDSKDESNEVAFTSDEKPTANVEGCSILLSTEKKVDKKDNDCTYEQINSAIEVKKKVNDFLIKYKLDIKGLEKYCDKYISENLDSAKAKAEEKKKKEEEDKKKQQEDKKKQQEAEEEAKKEAENQNKENKSNFINSCKIYGYKDIFRNADDYEGKNAKFTGQVIQVMDAGYGIVLRVDVTQDEFGLYDDTVYVTWSNKDKEKDPDAVKRILEDDIITMYGTLDGVQTYESTSGSDITIPKFEAKYIELVLLFRV